MTRDELRKLVKEVEQRCTELDNVEAKAVYGGAPRWLYESLSVFANRAVLVCTAIQSMPGFYPEYIQHIARIYPDIQSGRHFWQRHLTSL